MKCADIMDKNPLTLQTEDTIGTAIAMMLKHSVLALPVVDQQDVYQGTFAKSRLFGLLFPILGSVEDFLPQMATTTGIGAMPDKLPEVKDRLRALSNALVGTYADKTVPILQPAPPASSDHAGLRRTEFRPDGRSGIRQVAGCGLDVGRRRQAC